MGNVFKYLFIQTIMKIKDKKDALILILSIVSLLLLLVVAYTFLVKPVLNGLVTKGQNEGVQYAVTTIVQQAATCQQPVPLTVGNQTINLVALECYQNKQTTD